MSTYGRPQGLGYDYGTAARPHQAPGYPAFVQPQYGMSYTGTHAQIPSGLPNSAELNLMSDGQYQAHDPAYAQQNTSYTSFIPTDSRSIPEVIDVSPNQGPAGRKLFVYLNSAVDLTAPPTSLFTIIFGTKRCNALITKLANQAQRANYAVSADVPAFDTTGCSSPRVLLYLEIADATAAAMNMPLEIGHFTYTDATPFRLQSPSQSSLRKRKVSPTDDTPLSPSKRSATRHLRDSPINGTESQKTEHQMAGHDNLYVTRPQPDAGSYIRTYATSQHYAPNVHSSPDYGVSTSTAQMQLGAHPYNSYPPYMTADRNAAQVMSGSSSSANPPLVRTTVLQGSSGSVMPTTSFNPYAIYPSNAKAVLKLEGELNSMSTEWTNDEQMARRRIVRFRRSQNGSAITASFEPVTPEEHAQAPGCIYVNCIWWEEKQACFITSVDTIQLLESLVAVRFTVEEKNRIRRNLEGFRPLTVSKTRPDCEEFFKIVMGFPSPKPRNIEKDVKVFPWRILAHALKKIIGKYSASYSSTAAALPSPGPPTLRQQMSIPSPPSTGSSHSSTSYMAGNMGAPTMSSQHTTPTGYGVPTSGSGMMGIPTSQSVSWHQPSTSYATDMASGTRGSWDFSQYLDQASGGGPSAGMSSYQRIPSISESLGFGYAQPQEWRDYPQRTTHA